MAKNNRDHKQQRAQAKQKRLETVSKKSATGSVLQVPKLCRTAPLTDLSRDFYHRTGVDLLIGIPANVKYGPQTEEIAVPVGLEVQALSTQLMQLYAVCFNATLKNTCDEKEYTQSSLELLLEKGSAKEREDWTQFLQLINLARQFFCHYPYLWPNAVAEQGLNQLKHYLDVSAKPGSSCNQLLQSLIEQGENSWLQLQQYTAQKADALYEWIENAAIVYGNESADIGTWKRKISVLYQPTRMIGFYRQNWIAPIDWWWRKYQLCQRNAIGSYDKTNLMNTLENHIQKREAGLPVNGSDFVFLQDQIYLWAESALRYQFYQRTHTRRCGTAWARK